MHPCSFDSQGLLCWFPEVMATVNGFSCRRRLSRTRVAVAISICWANARAQKLGRVSPERCKDFFPGMRITQMSYISMLYKVYIYIYLACWSFRWGEIWVEVHSKNHPCVAWTSCGPCGSQSKLQDAELRLFEISEVGGSDPLWNYVCLLMVMVLWVFFLMTKWSCKLSSGKNSLQVYRLLWRLSECITQFGKFLGIPNVTLPAPDLKTLAM